MGYRSDVALALSRDGVKNLEAALSELGTEATVKEVRDLLAHPDRHLSDPESGAELWYWGDLKWYADYPDVAFIESFLASGTDEDNFRFIRIGEDYDDLEVAGLFLDDPFDLYVTRGIAFDSGGEDASPD